MRISRIFIFFAILCSISQVKAEDKVTVILDWFLNASHESLLAAQYSGAFKRYNLQVEMISPADPGTPSRLVAAGQADIAISYPIQLGMMIDHHIPLIRIGSLLNQPLNTLITLRNIKTLQDLKGKKIGVSVAGDDHTILKTMLEKTNVQLSDVQIINVNFQLEQALMTGAVDAVIGASRNYEVIDLEQKHYQFNIYNPEDYGVPIYDEMIFVTRPELVKDSRIIRFMQALKEGNVYLKSHSLEVFNKTIKDHPELNTPLNKTAWNVTLNLLPTDPVIYDKTKYQQFLDFLWNKKVIKHPVKISSFTAY
ncbi:ABC transporter substrate-binding protein [Commensalibacter melissae]|uniref:ABC transporter substrate-binding protein n=1 Tax=Commensalibacter melissae TaxID=2070537 RepID=UPI001E46531B|nr:ABC transporter substrate-binding protein [Commensalibacter melissae]